MGRSPCCSKIGLRRGPWSIKEDTLLSNYIQQNGEGQWRSLPKAAGLLRCGKSCRLRWMNYLRPGIKRGNISQDEEDLILRMHGLLGNRWSLIAGRLPGRTDNEIKNYWNTHLLRKLQTSGFQPKNHKPHKSKEIQPANKRNRKRAEGPPPDQKAIEIKNDSELPMKTKLYFPKPIRVSTVSSRTDSYDSLVSGASSSEADKVEEWPPLFELEDVCYGGGGDDFLRVECVLPLLHHQSNSFSGEDDMLEQVYYDEYLQLL